MTKKQFTLGEVANILEVTFSGDKKTIIKNLSTDSRASTSNSNTLFFAIKTNTNDGAKYIDKLIDKGVKSFVVHQIPKYKRKDINYLKVENTLKALQKLSAWKRNNFDLKTIGITGSNGKTVVKEWLFQLLNEDYNIVRSPKSYNSQIGVPLSVWEIKKEHNLAIFEAGISKPGEMNKLQNIVQPTIGIFTNIGDAHSENFDSQIQKINEKLILFKNAEKIFFKNENELGEQIKKSNDLKDVKKISWAFKGNANLHISSIEKNKKNTTIKGIFNGEKTQLKTPFTDDASIENSISIWLFMLDFGYDGIDINKRFSLLKPVEMRLEQVEGDNNCTIISDVYNLDIESLRIALDYLNTQFQGKKRTLIISSIQQHKTNANLLYSKVAELLKNNHIEKLILVGEEIINHKNLFCQKNIFCYNTTQELIQNLQKINFEGETILIKGARNFEFEKITTSLAKKNHDTTLEINLSTLIENINYFKNKLKPKTKLMVMVKAFSYGGGSYEIANILQYHNIDYLAVAYADEGKSLRKSGIKIPILVLNPEKSSYETLIKYNLEPEIYNIKTLKDYLKISENKKSYIHIKIDSGMHRLGFTQNDIEELSSIIKKHKNIEVKSIFSHLVASDNPKERKFTEKQAKFLSKTANKIIQTLDQETKPMIHLLNTAGVINYPEYQFDMVRLGLGIHGIASHTKDNNLKTIAKLKTIISQIKTIQKGDSVGYNRKFVAKKEMTIATLPIGYADGIDRRWGNEKGEVLIKNKRATIIGDIAMDMLMVDITNIKNCKEGNEVEIFHKEITVSEIARKIGTIPYEILTKISPRVKRIYFQE